MTKVIHIITKLEHGGAQLNTIFTVSYIDKKNFKIYLFSGSGGVLTDKVRIASNENRFSFSIIKTLVREIRPFKDLKTLLDLKKRIREISPDIVHTHSSKAGILGRIASKISGVKCITVHSVHGFPFSPNQKLLKRFFYSLIEKAGAVMTDRFIFVSKSDIETAKRKRFLKPHRSNYSLIRSGFEINKFVFSNEIRKNARDRFEIDSDMIIIGIIAPFKKQKGLFDMIAIASSVLGRRKNVMFFLAGDGGLRNELESLLKSKGIFSRFLMPGFIHDIENVIPSFDIGFSSALWEGLPQSIVQMRLCKIPVVANDIPSHHEIIHDGKNGIITNTHNHEIAADKLISLIDDPALREKIGGFKDDLSAWDGKRMVQDQERLYLELTGR